MLVSKAPKDRYPRTVKTANGFNEITVRAKNVIAFSSHGTVDVDFARSLIAELDAMLLVNDHLYLFADTWNVVDYDTAYRQAMTDWFIKNKARLRAVHCLVKRPLVKMGIGVINLVTSQLITVHKTQAEYEEQLVLTARDNGGR